MVAGIGGFLIAGWVCARRPAELAPRLLALNGTGLMIAALSAAVCSARQLAMDPLLMQFLMGTNHVGMQLFGLTLLLLMLSYPRPIVVKKVRHAIMACGAILIWLDAACELGDPGLFYLIVAGEALSALALIILQWLRAAGSPRDRASLSWLGLSALSVIGAWCALILAYALKGRLSQMPASAFSTTALLLYVGLALGVARFKLFELRDWTFRILFLTLAGAAVLLVDAGLSGVLGWNGKAATLTAILIVVAACVPFRRWLWPQLRGHRPFGETQMAEAALDIAFAPPPERSRKWQALLRGLFLPQRMEPANGPVPEAAIADDGLKLAVPCTAESPALVLSLARDGRGLFSPSHLRQVQELVRLVRAASQHRETLEREKAGGARP